MRKVLFTMNLSIDGCFGHTLFNPDEELMDFFTRLMLDTGLIVYGRKTYELMVPYWPEVAKSRSGDPGDLAFADAMTPIEKIVFSRTLKHAGENARIISEDPGRVIRELKKHPGKKIALSSTSMLGPLIEQDLIDELFLVIHPIIAGENERLFKNFLPPKKFSYELANARRFKSGAIALHYQK